MPYLFECRDCWYDNTSIAKQPLTTQLAAIATLKRGATSLWQGAAPGGNLRDWYAIFSSTQLRPLLELAQPWTPPALVLRGAFAAQDLLVSALLLEPATTRSFPGALAKSLLRWQLLNAAAESKSLLSWTAQPERLRAALAQTLRSDPSPYVRLEALRALGAAPVPVSWTGPLLESIRGAEAVLAETPFKQDERQALAKYLAEVTGKLQAAAAPSFTPVTVPGISEPVTTLDLQLPAVDPAPRRWVPWALGGLALVGLTSLGLWAHKRTGAQLTLPGEI